MSEPRDPYRRWRVAIFAVASGLSGLLVAGLVVLSAVGVFSLMGGLFGSDGENTQLADPGPATQVRQLAGTVTVTAPGTDDAGKLVDGDSTTTWVAPRGGAAVTITLPRPYEVRSVGLALPRPASTQVRWRFANGQVLRQDLVGGLMEIIPVGTAGSNARTIVLEVQAGTSIAELSVEGS